MDLKGLNDFEIASELGFKAGYEDFINGYDMRSAPYTTREHGILAPKLNVRWHIAYAQGHYLAHRQRGH